MGNNLTVNNNRDASWGNRHVGDSVKGGRPANAVGFAGEGNLAAFKRKDKRFTNPLDPLLKEQGITDEEWAEILEGLRSSWGRISKKAFKAKIVEFNEKFFHPKNLKAVYAEYGGKGGQAAMTVYTLKVWKSLPSSSDKKGVKPA